MVGGTTQVRHTRGLTGLALRYEAFKIRALSDLERATLGASF